MKFMEMAKRIKERRLLLGYTQENLGEKLGLQKSAIAKYENGRVHNIKKDVIKKLAETLRCNPSYLMGWEDDIGDSIVVEDLEFKEYMKKLNVMSVSEKNRVYGYIDSIVEKRKK